MVFDISLAHALGLLLAVGLPLLVGLVTKTVTDAGKKAVLLAGLAALTGLVSEWAAAVNAGVVFNLGSAALVALFAFLAGVGMHFGLYKPTGISARLQAVGDKGAH
jgi:hypothetical protein